MQHLIPLAVIGDPIAHSLSPMLHGDIIRRHCLPYSFSAYQIKAGDTADFIQFAKKSGIQGFNATMPHKQALLELVDIVQEDASYYESINTVRIRDGILTGYNTDVTGLLTSLAAKDIKLQGKNLLILGAGGVAGSIVRAAHKENAQHVTILNRTLDKAAEICAGVTDCEVAQLTTEQITHFAQESDLIINCTPLGMEGIGLDFEDFSFLDDTGATVLDLIYRPSETSLLREAKERGLATLNGLGMLIYQGILAFELFTDVELNHQEEAEQLEALLG